MTSFARLRLKIRYYALSPLPYHTANGKTVPAVKVSLRVDIRRVRIQVVTECSRASRSRPPITIRDASVDVAIRAIVAARTEKVERFAVNILGYFSTIFVLKSHYNF